MLNLSHLTHDQIKQERDSLISAIRSAKSQIKMLKNQLILDPDNQHIKSYLEKIVNGDQRNQQRLDIYLAEDNRRSGSIEF